MNYEQHLRIGILLSIIIGLIVSLNSDSFFLIEFGIFILLGSFSSIIPDIIEPPTSRWHRKFFHSVSILIIFIILILLSYGVYLNDPSSKLFYFSIAISTGYISHLFADALTPAGLPLL